MAEPEHTNMTRTERLRELEREKAKLLAEMPRRQIHGFIDFIREKGVVGLAIGLAIGAAASGLVNQIVNAVITPTINLIIGHEGLKGLNTTIHLGSHEAFYGFGDLIDALIKFLAIAAVIYFVVLGLKLDKLDKKKEDDKLVS
jgi:large conductance mechanosensitive channel